MLMEGALYEGTRGLMSSKCFHVAKRLGTGDEAFAAGIGGLSQSSKGKVCVGASGSCLGPTTVFLDNSLRGCFDVADEQGGTGTPEHYQLLTGLF